MKKENALAWAQSNLNHRIDCNTNSTCEVFNNAQFGDLTVIINENGSPWFIGAEVALKLGYLNIHDAFAKHCKRKKLTRDSRLSSTKHFGQRGIIIIPESDLYRLTSKSSLPEAEVFQDWVFEVVLPSIRKNGGYIQGQEELTPEELMAKALLVANNVIREKALENERLSNTVEDLTHQLATGITIASFCMQLNGVNTQKVQSELVKQDILIREQYGFRPASRFRNTKFACESYEFSPNRFSYKPIVTPDGASFLYKLYREDKLPMLKSWNGSYTTNQLTPEQLAAHI